MAMYIYTGRCLPGKVLWSYAKMEPVPEDTVQESPGEEKKLGEALFTDKSGFKRPESIKLLELVRVLLENAGMFLGAYKRYRIVSFCICAAFYVWTKENYGAIRK